MALKIPLYRNRKLLAVIKKAPQCFGCGRSNDGSVVGAHCNSQMMGKGMSLKSADLPAALCHDCHSSYDGRAHGAIVHNAHEQWAWAAIRTMRWVLENHPEVFR